MRPLRTEGQDQRIGANDIVCSGKKVCGILTEMSAEMDYINYIVIGIGINVYTEKFPDDIADVAISLYQENPKQYHRAQLISDILKARSEEQIGRASCRERVLRLV